MANLKTQFSELRKNTPKHVQWLLLAAAFIVVLILLTLLLKGDKKPAVEAPATTSATITIDPDAIDWTDTKVGDTKSQRFVISADSPVKVDTVRLSAEVPGLSKPKTTCTNIGQISDKISCSISVEYTPKAPSDTTGASLFVDWRGATQPENMKRTDKITIAVAATAVAPKVEPKPEPIAAPVVAPKPIIQEEIEAIAPSDPFAFEMAPFKPEPKAEPVAVKPAPAATAARAEDCSDFAFAGYGMSGQQIGWIKPKGGTYMFHPFADKTCSNPTGIYNPDNGIITDINNVGKKIGTDADHIGFASITNGAIPQLSNPVAQKNVNRARQLNSAELAAVTYGGARRLSDMDPNFVQKQEKVMTSSGTTVVSTKPYDRTFILRQYKPIPATIVSEIRADQALLNGEYKLPVIATVDRNVYSDNGRTIIIPTGTTLYGYVSGDVPGPYKSIGRMEVRWYQFVRPDGVEFNFGGDANDPFSADAQGRVGVPGRGSTDYMEQFIMPMLTAIVPAAVNMIAPISDRFINQIDLDNNTVTQSGQVRSSELAKNEIITAWNQVAQKLLVDMMDNTVPPFSIAAGTRITVFSPVDLQVTCGLDGSGKKCAISEFGNPTRANPGHKVTGMAQSAENAGSTVGQVRSFNLDGYCAKDSNGNFTGAIIQGSENAIAASGYDYRTVLYYCQSSQYKAINNAKQEAVYQNQQQTTYTNPTSGNKMQIGSKDYNENVLGLNYDDQGVIENPFKPLPQEQPPVTLTCEDGTPPDGNGCCTGETYTDMGEQGFNCCPAGGGDCFPPII